MKLIKLRIVGFQSFSDTEEIEFADGINLIIGQNNSGKSALLRSMLPTLPDDRHRTPEKWEDFKLRTPQVFLTIDASGAEVRDWALQSSNQNYFPIPTAYNIDVEAFAQELFERPSLILPVSRVSNQEFSASYPSHRLFEYVPGTQQATILVTADNGELKTQRFNQGQDTLPKLLSDAWHRDMFYFAAERMQVGEAAPGYGDRLNPNASNLPNVLHTMSGERGDVFQQLILHLREIFSTVGNLSVRTKREGQLEIRVWPTEAMERVELSFPLNSGGTGVSQVIALLTAIITIKKAVIIIDEINSFLHPAAVKALLRILQTQYTQHQYIISTHAPEVVSFSNPKTIHLVKRSGYESSVSQLDLGNVGNFREVAEHLGVSMADVFAAERVVWVEGPTEELCFPYLYQKLVSPLPRGTIITSVAATGDFNSNKRDPAIVYEVYDRLSKAAATLVVSVAFSFDTEKLSDDEKLEMQRKANGMLHFLPRRHFECYLIEPAAIAAFIASKDPVLAEAVTPAVVDTALREGAAERPLLIPEWNGDITNGDWLAKVDAAKLIMNVCGTLSEQRVPFSKKNDSLFLLKHILEQNPERLEPLKDYVLSLVGSGAPS